MGTPWRQLIIIIPFKPHHPNPSVSSYMLYHTTIPTVHPKSLTTTDNQPPTNTNPSYFHNKTTTFLLKLTSPSLFHRPDLHHFFGRHNPNQPPSISLWTNVPPISDGMPEIKRRTHQIDSIGSIKFPSKDVPTHMLTCDAHTHTHTNQWPH